MLVFRLVRILSLVTVAAALGISHAAAAATFDGVGTHSLTSSNLSFTSAGLNGGSVCSSSVFTANVATGGATATVTGATFDGCTGTDGLAGFPVTVTVTNLPWTFTRTGAGAFAIDGIHLVVDVRLILSLSFTYGGNLGSGTINNTTHTVTYNNATGLTATASTGGSASATVSGDFRDDQNSLAVT
jgi:hypothetical protein